MSQSFTDCEIAELFDAIPCDEPIAVAVSGGGDSMALLSLMRRRTNTLTALTVDHHLRPESAEEARSVSRYCAAHGIGHEILNWIPDSQGNLSNQARIGRYTLMAEVCAARNIGTLVTGHTLDDQAETVLMRLGRGSGVDGLSGIRHHARLWGVQLIRPLLKVSRERLRDYLRSEEIPWVDDPTNEDRQYMRVQARDALKTLSRLGITPERLSRTAHLMGEASKVLEKQANLLAASICDFSPLGFVSFDPARLYEAPRETALRLLARLLCMISGQSYRPRLDTLDALLTALSDISFTGCTLHGCRIDPHLDRCVIQREPAACTAIARVTSSRVRWDERFEVVVPEALKPWSDFSIAAAGEKGLHRLKAEKVILSKDWTASPHPARLCTPALWQGDALIGIPLAGWVADQRASGATAVTIDAVPVDPDAEAFI